MKLANRYKVPLTPRGAGTSVSCGAVPALGGIVVLTEQVGHYDFEAAISLAEMAKSYGVGLKEHNADYLDDVTLLEHTPANVTASNVAPQYGTEETRAYLKLTYGRSNRLGCCRWR